MFRSASDCMAVVEAFMARGISLFLLDLNGADDVSSNDVARLFPTIVPAFAARGVRLSHITVRKIIAGRKAAS